MPLLQVNSDKVKYTEDAVTSEYTYHTTHVARSEDGKMTVTPVSKTLNIKTVTKLPKTGVMVVGLGGNNGSTFTAGIVANREGISWRTKSGVNKPNYFGSLTQASTVRVGEMDGEEVYVPMKDVVPMVNPNDLVVGGWDISAMNLADAMERAGVLPYDLQRQLVSHLKEYKPLPSIYVPDFIAANQGERADNVLTGSLQEQLETLRANIRDFKSANSLDKVVVLWSANTERFADIMAGVNDTADNLLAAIKAGHSEIAPSTIFAVASVLEGSPYINGSPQNTFVPGLVELALRHNVFIGGDDFKSGQTKLKSCLVEWLVNAGIKPTAIVSYNHLGNNDGKNLSAPAQFRSKEVSKSNVVDDMVHSNRVLYDEGEHPDHCVVIKYVPTVGDSKRAMDEYTNEIFMGGLNTLVIHNTCEDSLLAVPLMYDLVLLAELSQRISFEADGETQGFHPVLSLLSFLLKAPMVPEGTPVVNAMFRQRAAIENVLRSCVGLPAENNMLLEHKLRNGKTFLSQ